MKLTTFHPEQNMDCFFETDSFFENTFPFGGSKVEFLEPRINIKDVGEAFVVEATVPGYNKDEIDLKVEGDTLSLSGDKKQDKIPEAELYSKQEFLCSSFKRCFDLGEQIERERISAEVKNGVLTVNLPKKEKEQSKKNSDYSKLANFLIK